MNKKGRGPTRDGTRVPHPLLFFLLVTNVNEEKQPPVKEGDVIDVTPFKPADKKEHAIAKIDGFVLFVKNGIPNEKCSCKVSEVKKTYAWAERIEIKAPRQ